MKQKEAKISVFPTRQRRQRSQAGQTGVMRFFSLTGFTLTELMVIVIIAGIVAAVAVPVYVNTNEKARDKEAVTALRAIKAAQQQYFSRMKSFVPLVGVTEGNITLINNALGLALDEDAWDYSMTGIPNGFVASASRAGRTWSLNHTLGNPVCAPSGSCF